MSTSLLEDHKEATMEEISTFIRYRDSNTRAEYDKLCDDFLKNPAKYSETARTLTHFKENGGSRYLAGRQTHRNLNLGWKSIYPKDSFFKVGDPRDHGSWLVNKGCNREKCTLLKVGSLVYFCGFCKFFHWGESQHGYFGWFFAFLSFLRNLCGRKSDDDDEEDEDKRGAPVARARPNNSLSNLKVFFLVCVLLLVSFACVLFLLSAIPSFFQNPVPKPSPELNTLNINGVSYYIAPQRSGDLEARWAAGGAD